MSESINLLLVNWTTSKIKDLVYTISVFYKYLSEPRDGYKINDNTLDLNIVHYVIEDVYCCKLPLSPCEITVPESIIKQIRDLFNEELPKTPILMPVISYMWKYISKCMSSLVDEKSLERLKQDKLIKIRKIVNKKGKGNEKGNEKGNDIKQILINEIGELTDENINSYLDKSIAFDVEVKLANIRKRSREVPQLGETSFNNALISSVYYIINALIDWLEKIEIDDLDVKYAFKILCKEELKNNDDNWDEAARISDIIMKMFQTEGYGIVDVNELT